MRLSRSVTLFVAFVLLQIHRNETENCPEVLIPKAVWMCPTSSEEYDRADRKKECLQTASKLNCSAPDKFKYHCVINSFQNETFEVCAHEKIIFGGYCTEYNEVGGLIQAQRTSKCSDSLNCAKIYRSTKSYNYQDCYNLVYNNRTTTSTTVQTDMYIAKSITKTHSNSDALKMDILLSTIVISIIVFAVVAVGILYEVKQTNNRRQRRAKEEEIESEQRISLLERDVAVGTTTEEETTTDVLSFAVQKRNEDLSKKNEVESNKYLTNYEVIDEYFVETSSYKRGKEVFEKYGIVIWTGPPGCGKTLAAIHLIFENKAKIPKLAFRKIRSFEELSYIQDDSKYDRETLIFIDNIFDSHSVKSYLPNWWEKLDKVHKTFFQIKESKVSLYSVRFVITARENVLERACSLMGAITPILNENHRIDAKGLLEDEKEEILIKQIDFAKERMNVSIPKMNKDLRARVKNSEGPIGFPLCVHLFVCSDKYQKSGEQFFTCPIEYIKRQINDEIECDKSNRTKSLLFVLFFHEWFTKRGNSKILDLNSDYHCEFFLDYISASLRTNFEPFDFKELLPEAQRLVGTFLKEESKSSFKFVHDSVYEAVGAWLCETYIIQTAKHFPLEIIQNEAYENLGENTQAQTVLASRLFDETLNQRISQVFASKCFQQECFCACFLKELKKNDDKTVIEFLTVTNESSSVNLSCMFWTSWNNLTYLTEELYNLVKDKYSKPTSEHRLYASLHKEKYVDLPDYHLYVSLYGKCCTRKEDLLVTVNGKLRDDFDEIKKRVLEFEDEEGNTTLHLILTSESTDRFTSVIVEKLLNDKMSLLNARNKSRTTPLMLAVCQTKKRTEVIKRLMECNPKLNFTDARNSNVFHYCLSSCNDDETCAKYLNIVLQGENAKKNLAKDDSKGNTPLCTAAMETRCSRILSIWTILEAANDQSINTINEDGFAPLHLSINSLNKSTSKFAELECCVRVILLLSFGASLEDNPDKNQATECKFDSLKDIFEKPKDEKNMIHILDSLLEKIEECKDITGPVQCFSTKIRKNLATQIRRAAHILKHRQLDMAE
uniref:Uncharacterized protein LOC111104674 isoform X2 n=1 Tax=Crassostrea virginica TaxID=6565 RepID=A0A8B8ASS8_CRAVI|nr:uncharacterized protein LOC111104674 isoform X2 [Crassostrea virginica]